MRGWRGIGVVGLVCWAQVLVEGQGSTFRGATELIGLNVTVLGADSRPVEGLPQSAFEVFEDGVPQQLKFFAPGELALDVVLLLDTSSSMTGSMPLVQSAASRFVEALGAEDRASVMGISGGLRILQAFSHDKALVTAAIKATAPRGRTPLYASIYAALHELEKTRRSYQEPRRQALVVLSDGVDTASAFGFDELMTSVRRHAVPIYTIAPRPSVKVKQSREMLFGETTNQQDFELRRLAAETGARAFFPTALKELTGVYEEIASELAHQYSLGYHSSNAAQDGGYRHIVLRVSTSGVKWRARAGYVAERDRAADDTHVR